MSTSKMKSSEDILSVSEKKEMLEKLFTINFGEDLILRPAWFGFMSSEKIEKDWRDIFEPYKHTDKIGVFYFDVH